MGVCCSNWCLGRWDLGHLLQPGAHIPQAGLALELEGCGFGCKPSSNGGSIQALCDSGCNSMDEMVNLDEIQAAPGLSYSKCKARLFAVGGLLHDVLSLSCPRSSVSP